MRQDSCLAQRKKWRQQQNNKRRLHGTLPRKYYLKGFQVRAVVPLVERFVKAKDRNREQPHTESKHRHHLRPENVEADALQVSAAQDYEEISQRAEISKILQPLRHGADGKSKAGEGHGGHNEEERCHHGLLLSGGDRRDEESDAQHAEQEQNGTHKQHGNLSAERNLEP